MKRFLAVAAALSFVACSAVSPAALRPGVEKSFSVFPPYTVVVEEPVASKGFKAPIDIRDITEDALAIVAKRFDARFAAGDRDIQFRLDTYGGSIFAGMDFIQHIKDYKKAHSDLTVTCTVDSKAYSMGFVFLQTFCDKRQMTYGSTLLAHNGSTEVKGTVVEILNQAKFLQAINDAMALLVSRRLGISVGAYKEKVDGRDWTMACPEALAVNAVDACID